MLQTISPEACKSVETRRKITQHPSKMFLKSVPGGLPDKLGRPRALPDPTENALSDLTFPQCLLTFSLVGRGFLRVFDVSAFRFFGDSLKREGAQRTPPPQGHCLGKNLKMERLGSFC